MNDRFFYNERVWEVGQLCRNAKGGISFYIFFQRHGLDTFMFDAILNDQEAFVSLFVENGFDLEAFLTVHTLEKLYTASMQKKVSGY